MKITGDDYDTNDKYQLEAVNEYKILIVDDQKFNIDALLIILEYFVKVDTSVCDSALSGQSAFEKVEANVIKNNYKSCDYKIILMDHEMPFMSGNQACRKIVDFLNGYLIDKPVMISVSGN